MDRSELGRIAEGVAADHLAGLGYAVIERNFRCDLGELDLVAWQGGDLVFVEIRSRADADHGDASYAVGQGKQRQVARVAEAYLSQRRPSFTTARFDVVAITGDHIEVFVDAFRVGLR